MPLIDLKTNLKDLRFGNDRPGYGSSGLPYIQTRMPDTPNATGTFNPIYRPGSSGNLDWPIRGGDIAFSIGQQTFTLSSQLDRSRIKKFFEDAPRGEAFIKKQIGLQLSNPKIETGNTLFGIPQGFAIPGLLENTRVYNQGKNTLAQVGVAGSGAHAIRHGLVPFAPFQKHYFDIVNQQNVANQSLSNRLLIMSQLKMTTGQPFVNVANVPDINRVNTLGISLNRNLLFQYLGGPESVYGVGITTINRTVDTTKLRSVTAMTYDLLNAQKSQLGNGAPKLTDFRESLPALKTTYVPWGNQTVDKRFYVSPGKYKDKLNSQYPFGFNNKIAPWEINKTETDDLIKFVFEAISNDDPTISTAIFFRAFLTAGITDNNTAQLNPFKYMGRGENFYTYQGFDRSVSFSFRVAAGSKDELRPMYNRLNMLMSQVYPDYSGTTNIMRAPVIRLTVGDYLYRMPGFLENVNITVDNNTPWDINLDGDSAQLPQVVDVSVSFKPIFDVLPKRSGFTTIDNNKVTTQTTEDGTTITTNDTVQNATVTPLITNPNGDFIKQLNNTIRNSVQIQYANEVAENTIDNSALQTEQLQDYLDSLNSR